MSASADVLRHGVKQFVARVQNSRGRKFNVFTTGDAKFYLFDPLDADDCSVSMQFPVEKARLNDTIRKMLAHGYGNCS